MKNDIIEIVIDGMGINGEGIGRVEGKTVFIKGALVGERVRAKIIFEKKTFCVAIIEKILKESQERVSPQCENFGKCGGCALQHLAYESQLKYKRSTVAETFKKVAGIDVEPQEITPSKRQYRYRNKLSFPVRNNPFSVGLFASGSHRLVPVCDCKIQSMDAKIIVEMFSDFMRQNSLVGYDETSGKGDARHLVVRGLSGMSYVTVVTPRAALPQIKAFNGMLENKFGNMYALYLNFNAQMNNIILGERTEFIGGNESAILVDGLKVHAHPKSFFQVNDEVREAIYERVEKAVSGTVIDAYSGAGILSARIAKTAKMVYAIELESAAVEAAQKLAIDNNISNIKLVRGDCEVEIPKVVESLNGEKFDIVLDPPRSGCSKAALDSIVAAKANKIVYISCAPPTLARDVKILADGGYKIDSVSPYDMFPNTTSIETVVELSWQE